MEWAFRRLHSRQLETTKDITGVSSLDTRCVVEHIILRESEADGQRKDTLLANKGLQYYSNSYIEGAVDFIYGSATAWFGECTIANSRASGGYIVRSRFFHPSKL
jgi:hypothetical protein